MQLFGPDDMEAAARRQNARDFYALRAIGTIVDLWGNSAQANCMRRRSGGLEKLKKRWLKEAFWSKETLRDAIQF